jgi:dTDP-4-dehydrorhamnose 3,5-epimerase
MERIATPLDGAFLIQPEPVADRRGCLVKTIHEPTFAAWGIAFDLREEFFSVSRRGVLRGMHFQAPPHAHDKIVYCIAGGVLDVILDLRRASATFGRWYAMELDAANRRVLLIPRGLAHGFLSLRDDTIMVYKTSKEHMPDCDRGVLWNSFGFAWPVTEPLLSERDANLPPFAEFGSPF